MKSFVDRVQVDHGRSVLVLWLLGTVYTVVTPVRSQQGN